MAKPKSPLLSLGARGTIADALTYQKRGQGTIVREKPIPKDPYSLNQAYQRWDYRDYAYLWTLLSNSEKQLYRTKASRYHITGFSQWMRERLNELTDLAGRWHLDEKAGSIAYDTSRNANNATIIGASPTAGLIDGGFYFDGLNDWLRIPHSPALDFPTLGSIELDVYLSSKSGLIVLASKPNPIGTLRPHELWFDQATDRFYFAVYDGAWHMIADTLPPQLFTWYHLTGLWDGTRIYIVRDTTKTPGPLLAAMPTTTRFLSIGTLGNALSSFHHGRIDNIALHSRLLPDAEIQRHSERRYPA